MSKGDADSTGVLHLFPGPTLAPTSLMAVQLSQITSCVLLLDFYCHKNCWSLPEYQLYSTLGEDGMLLLLYKVGADPSTRSSVTPQTRLDPRFCSAEPLRSTRMPACVCSQVIIPSTQSTFVPDKLCVTLDDAKELAAQTALLNLGTHLHVHNTHKLFTTSNAALDEVRKVIFIL